MEDNLILMLLLIVIGALVGGGTNIIAIQMLFRPHRTISIGSWRVPFTPGLIPKRREELATQLGRMVEEHLLTPEGISDRLLEEGFIGQLGGKLSSTFNTFLTKDITIQDCLNEHGVGQWSIQDVRSKYEVGLQRKLLSLVNEYKDRTIDEILLDDWKKRVDELIPELSKKIVDKAELYLHSEEGQDQLDSLLTRFFESRGNIGGVFARMVQRVPISTMFTKELTKFLQDDHTHFLLTSWLEKEWRTVLDKTPEAFFTTQTIEEKIRQVTEHIVTETPLIGEWDQPINKWGPRYQRVVNEAILPNILQLLSFVIKRHLSSALRALEIRNIVRDQVNQFSLERLEALLLSIAGRELKMIAVFGAILGGVIGLLQGIIILLVL